MKITLTNDFHNTSTIVHVDDRGWITERQLKRARKALCGVDGCSCGGDAGERGPQEHEASVCAMPDGDAIVDFVAGEYVMVTELETWSQDEDLSDEEQAAACQRAQDYCTEHEGDLLSIEFRPIRAGEAAGLYERNRHAELQILGYSIPRPAEVDELVARAWQHALDTWPEALAE